MAKVMIGVPMHSGSVSAQTVQSIFVGMSKVHKVEFQLLGLSLLAKNFNLLFCGAVRKGYDYFLLHHSDLGIIGAMGRLKGSWIDLMIERLNKFELAALAVSSPIKSDNGLTSAGIETVADDPWSLRRTTIKEQEHLPATLIERDDLCSLYSLDPNQAGAQLINTGCLLMDIRNGGGIWRDKKWPGFSIVDDIRWNTKGIPESFTVPEDWNMSSWMHKNNVPFACTRELLLCHVGSKNFMNHGNWGDEHDGPRQQMNADEYEKS